MLNGYGFSSVSEDRGRVSFYSYNMYSRRDRHSDLHFGTPRTCTVASKYLNAIGVGAKIER